MFGICNIAIKQKKSTYVFHIQTQFLYFLLCFTSPGLISISFSSLVLYFVFKLLNLRIKLRLWFYQCYQSNQILIHLRKRRHSFLTRFSSSAHASAFPTNSWASTAPFFCIITKKRCWLQRMLTNILRSIISLPYLKQFYLTLQWSHGRWLLLDNLFQLCNSLIFCLHFIGSIRYTWFFIKRNNKDNLTKNNET